MTVGSAERAKTHTKNSQSSSSAAKFNREAQKQTSQARQPNEKSKPQPKTAELNKAPPPPPAAQTQSTPELMRKPPNLQTGQAANRTLGPEQSNATSAGKKAPVTPSGVVEAGKLPTLPKGQPVVVHAQPKATTLPEQPVKKAPVEAKPAVVKSPATEAQPSLVTTNMPELPKGQPVVVDAQPRATTLPEQRVQRASVETNQPAANTATPLAKTPDQNNTGTPTSVIPSLSFPAFENISPSKPIETRPEQLFPPSRPFGAVSGTTWVPGSDATTGSQRNGKPAGTPTPTGDNPLPAVAKAISDSIIDAGRNTWDIAGGLGNAAYSAGSGTVWLAGQAVVGTGLTVVDGGMKVAGIRNASGKKGLDLGGASNGWAWYNRAHSDAMGEKGLQGQLKSFGANHLGFRNGAYINDEANGMCIPNEASRGDQQGRIAGTVVSFVASPRVLAGPPGTTGTVGTVAEGVRGTKQALAVTNRALKIKQSTELAAQGTRQLEKAAQLREQAGLADRTLTTAYKYMLTQTDNPELFSKSFVLAEKLKNNIGQISGLATQSEKIGNLKYEASKELRKSGELGNDAATVNQKYKEIQRISDQINDAKKMGKTQKIGQLENIRLEKAHELKIAAREAAQRSVADIDGLIRNAPPGTSPTKIKEWNDLKSIYSNFLNKGTDAEKASQLQQKWSRAGELSASFKERLAQATANGNQPEIARLKGLVDRADTAAEAAKARLLLEQTPSAEKVARLQNQWEKASSLSKSLEVQLARAKSLKNDPKIQELAPLLDRAKTVTESSKTRLLQETGEIVGHKIAEEAQQSRELYNQALRRLRVEEANGTVIPKLQQLSDKIDDGYRNLMGSWRQNRTTAGAEKVIAESLKSGGDETWGLSRATARLDFRSADESYAMAKDALASARRTFERSGSITDREAISRAETAVDAARTLRNVAQQNWRQARKLPAQQSLDKVRDRGLDVLRDAGKGSLDIANAGARIGMEKLKTGFSKTGHGLEEMRQANSLLDRGLGASAGIGREVGYGTMKTGREAGDLLNASGGLLTESWRYLGINGERFLSTDVGTKLQLGGQTLVAGGGLLGSIGKPAFDGASFGIGTGFQGAKAVTTTTTNSTGAYLGFEAARGNVDVKLNDDKHSKYVLTRLNLPNKKGDGISDYFTFGVSTNEKALLPADLTGVVALNTSKGYRWDQLAAGNLPGWIDYGNMVPSAAIRDGKAGGSDIFSQLSARWNGAVLGLSGNMGPTYLGADFSGTVALGSLGGTPGRTSFGNLSNSDPSARYTVYLGPSAMRLAYESSIRTPQLDGSAVPPLVNNFTKGRTVFDSTRPLIDGEDYSAWLRGGHGTVLDVFSQYDRSSNAITGLQKTGSIPIGSGFVYGQGGSAGNVAPIHVTLNPFDHQASGYAMVFSSNQYGDKAKRDLERDFPTISRWLQSSGLQKPPKPKK